jgi:hypothetical protein
MLRPKRGEGEDWGKMHNEEFHSLFAFPYILSTIRSKSFEICRAYESYGGVSKFILYLSQNTLEEETPCEMT